MVLAKGLMSRETKSLLHWKVRIEITAFLGEDHRKVRRRN